MKVVRFNSFWLMLVLGMVITIMASCKKDEESENVTITCTQAYYPTDNVEILHYAVDNHRGYNDDTNHRDRIRTYIESCIWTADGVPGIVRFFLIFDLSDYYNTKKTLIRNTSLYLYGHPTYQDHSSNKLNKHVFNRVVGDWPQIFSWNNQPNIDETTNVITDHIPGTLNEPRRDNYVFNLNNILLKNGRLQADYKGISCRPYHEDINDYYRRVTFASRDFDDESFFPTLKVGYAFPLPKIKFGNNVFRVTNNEDLNALFKNVQYVWTINGVEKTGENVHFESKDKPYTVYLQIIITNNIGEVSEYGISKTF